MRRIKILAILAATALVAIGVFGVASASAGTVLCSEPDKTTCAPSAVQPKGSTLKTFAFRSSESLDFRFRIEGKHEGDNKDRIRCRDNELNLKTTMKNGNPLPAELQSSVDPAECRTWGLGPGSVCASATLNSPPTTVDAGQTGAGIVYIGSASQPLTLSFTCKWTIAGFSWSETCAYKASGPTEMEVSPGVGTATIWEPLVKTAGGGSTCGVTDIVLRVDNETHPPTTNFISEATETVLCAVSRIQASPCPNAQVKPAGTQFFTGQPHQEGGLWLNSWLAKSFLSCPGTKGQTTMWFGTGEEAGAPLEVGSEMFGSGAACSFWNGEGTCSSLVIGVAETTSEDVSATMESTGVNTATIKLGTSGHPFAVGFTCKKTPEGPSQSCLYWSASGPVEMNINYTGWPDPTVMGKAEASLALASGDPKLCGESVELKFESMVDQKSAINIV